MDIDRSPDDNLYLRILQVGSVVVDPSWWRFRYPGDLYWRLYRNEQDGAFLTVRGERTALEAGRLYVIPAQLPMELACVSRVGHFFVPFDVAGLPEIALRELFHEPFGNPVAPHWESLLREAVSGLDPHWPELGQPVGIATQCRLKGVLYEVLAQYLQTLSAERIERCWYLADRVRPILPAVSYIEGHLGEDLSNLTLARSCSMSEGHFIRVFHACIGQTPAQYVIERRVQTAMRRLLLTSETIEEIADQTGFGSRHYFSRLFMRQIGQSPAAFRRAQG
jgi:AraC-like DNA-binding protein